MSMLELTSLGILEQPANEAGETTLAAWLLAGHTVSTKVAMQLVTRAANALCEAHRQGIRHGALSVEKVVLSLGPSGALGPPTLRGFEPSAFAWPRREDVAVDVAGLAGIAQQLLVPLQPQPASRSRRATSPPALPDWRGRDAVRAVIGAALDLREGVFLFDSPLDFVVALEAAIAADSGAARAKTDPALRTMHLGRRRRRLIKVLAGAAVACLALLAVSSATAMWSRSGDASRTPVARISE